MSMIRILPPALVNRIAAGECVERPSNVNKELVENSLDAGAARVDVEIQDGGRELISVRDDGGGMSPDDLKLAIHPHATSKITTDDDLFNIHTMGFRGEALASIGSVSRLTLTSRTRDAEVAHAIRVEGGTVAGPSPCAAPVGTLVEVRDLFFTVPARRKFLKTSATEAGHITEQLARIALAHPGVAFSLRNNHKLVHNLAAATNPTQRIRDFYGPEIADVLLPISRDGQGVRVEGLVAPPRESRGASKWEYVFVNGRYVRDRFVSHAIKEAYRSLIDPSRYPVAFVFITIDPGHVDVNVHPTKIEVRWRDSNYIHGQVLAALREKFLMTNLDHRLSTRAVQSSGHEAGAPSAAASADFVLAGGPAEQASLLTELERNREREADQYREHVRSAMVDFFMNTGASTLSRAAGASPAERLPAAHDPAPGHRASAPLAEPRSTADREEHARAAQPQPAAARDQPPRPAALHGPAIQIHRTYLVVETADGVMIIDQHALHERILYEELKRRVTLNPLESQRLLLPDVVRVPADRHEALETHAAMLARLGIDLTVSGPQTVTLHAFPSLLERADRERFVRDLLDLLSQPGVRPDTDTLLHSLLDMMACKAAVKAGDPLTPDEIAALVARRETAERSSHCPHGRPTTLHLTLRDLERQFRRR
jgi:DNA mismatch repair protein MutL